MVSDEEGSRRIKRRKVAESCKSCRAKKTRCDGQRPACAPCRAKQTTCEYNDVTVPISVGKLEDLEARLQELEQRRTIVVPPETPVTADNTPQRLADGQPLNSNAQHQETTLSSASGLVAEVSRSLVEHAPPNVLKEFWGEDSQLSRMPQLSHGSLVNEASMVVPPRSVADDLLNRYEAYVHPLFPVLHIPTIRAGYEQIWESRPRVTQRAGEKVVLHAILDNIFALGCLNNSVIEPHLKLQNAFAFYKRAQALLPLSELDFASLEVVQCLLLTAIYLSYTKYSNRACNTLAIAMRMAQELGLHMDVNEAQLTREMRRRVWHHCVFMERLFASIFSGKIVLKPHWTVPLPASIDDQYLAEGSQPTNVPSLIDAFNVSVRAFEIVEAAQKIDYALLKDRIQLSEMSQILQLNDRIDQIERDLPYHLKVNDNDTEYTPREACLKLQAAGLAVRIYHLRLLILRPVLLAAAHHVITTSTALLTTSADLLFKEMAGVAVNSATSAINTLWGNLESASRVISSSAVFVTLSSATVLIAASLIPGLDVGLERGNLYGDLMEKAKQVLYEHRWQIEGAIGAKNELEKLESAVVQAKERRAADRVSEDLSAQQPFDFGSIFGDGNFVDTDWNIQQDDFTALLNVSGPYLDYFSWGYPNSATV